MLCDSGKIPNADFVMELSWSHGFIMLTSSITTLLTIDNWTFLLAKCSNRFQTFTDQTIRKLLGLKLISVLTMHHSIDNCNYVEISLMWPHLKGEKEIGKSVHTLQTLSTNRWGQSSELNHNGSNGERKSCRERERGREREKERGGRERERGR